MKLQSVLLGSTYSPLDYLVLLAEVGRALLAVGMDVDF